MNNELENETKIFHTGEFLIIFKGIPFLCQTVDTHKLVVCLYLYSSIHMNIQTRLCMYIELLKKTEILFCVSGQVLRI